MSYNIPPQPDREPTITNKLIKPRSTQFTQGGIAFIMVLLGLLGGAVGLYTWLINIGEAMDGEPLKDSSAYLNMIKLGFCCGLFGIAVAIGTLKNKRDRPVQSASHYDKRDGKPAAHFALVLALIPAFIVFVILLAISQ